MLNSPKSQPTGKRKRKVQRVVESDNDSEYERQAVKVEEGTIKMEDSTTVEEQSIKSEALQDQIIKAEASTGPTSPNKQAGKRKAITRTPRKNAAKSPDKFNPQEEAHEDGTAEAKGKNKDSDEGRLAKRPRLPSMRRNASTTAVSTPIGGNTPTVEKSMPAVVGSSTTVPSRQIVDGPVSNEIDMRDGKAFSSLLKKASSIKSEARYDLTATEKMELKKAELAKLREEYIAQKAREKVVAFDLGAQNRKLVDVQRLLERRGSRVCVNVVGSCILTINKEWIKLAAAAP